MPSAGVTSDDPSDPSAARDAPKQAASDAPPTERADFAPRSLQDILREHRFHLNTPRPPESIPRLTDLGLARAEAALQCGRVACLDISDGFSK